MNKRLDLLSVWLFVFALLSGCVDSPPPSTAPAQQPAAAKPPAPASVVAATKPQIVRGSLRFIEGYQAGMAAANEQKKPVLLFFTATWCHYCHQLAADAFNDATVVNLSEQFVCVLVDADREPEVCTSFRVRSYPTIQFVSARGQVLNRMVGKRPGRELSRQMHAALQTLARASEREQAAF